MFFYFLSNELLMNATSCPKLICNLPFKITLPRRIPPVYSILVNQIPRDWDMATIQPLLIERYQSVGRFTRISREGKATTRIRIDFSSQNHKVYQSFQMFQMRPTSSV